MKERDVTDEFDALMKLSYEKGQAYYKFDFYGANEDADQNWDEEEEPDFKKRIAAFKRLLYKLASQKDDLEHLKFQYKLALAEISRLGGNL